MIAGTTFLLADIDSAMLRYRRRIRKAMTPREILSDAAFMVHDGRALCLEGPDGMLILSAMGRADGARLLVECKVLLAVSSGVPGAFKRQEQAVIAIARDLGAALLTFRTDRRGWPRLLRMLGADWRREGEYFIRSV